MTEYYNFPLLIRVRVISVESCVAKDWHFDFKEERDNEFEDSEGEKLELSGVYKEDFIKRFIVFLSWNPFAVGPIGHGRIENSDF